MVLSLIQNSFSPGWVCQFPLTYMSHTGTQIRMLLKGRKENGNGWLAGKLMTVLHLILFNAISKASLLRLHKIILTHKITVKEKSLSFAATK